MATTQTQTETKSFGTAFVLWFFFGAFGAHRFYLKAPHAKAMLFTLGGLGFWALSDIFRLRRFVDEANAA